jgi:hypothetical protein
MILVLILMLVIVAVVEGGVVMEILMGVNGRVRGNDFN